MPLGGYRGWNCLTINTFKKHVSVELDPETVNDSTYLIQQAMAMPVPTQAIDVVIDIDGTGKSGEC